MPIEIRELIIKATISDQEENKTSSGKLTDVDRELIVKECIDQILEITNKRKER